MVSGAGRFFDDCSGLGSPADVEAFLDFFLVFFFREGAATGGSGPRAAFALPLLLEAKMASISDIFWRKTFPHFF